MMNHLPALQVVIPLIAAPLCALMVRPNIAWWFAMAVTWVTFGISSALLHQVLDGGAISYHMGGWRPPLGISYEIDPLNALLLVLVSGMAVIVMPAAKLGIGVEVTQRAQRLFYTVALLALTGMLGIVITGDTFNLYVFLEISSLSSYALVAMGTHRRASKAAFNYLILGTIGATFILIGIGLIYMMTGTLNMADLAIRLRNAHDTAPVQAALAFIVVGAGIKAAMFPAHIWMPNAYTYAPSVVSAFFGATATKVGAYILIRFIFNVFGYDFAFERLQIGWFLVPLGLAGAFIGSLVAIWQDDLKRMLAYSSVAQVGYIIAALGFGNHDGLVAAIVHVFNHGLMKGALFMVMACVILRLGSSDISVFRGLGRRMPVTMGCFVVAGLSMIGVPFTVGFISKWYLILGALDADMWPVAVLIVMSSLLSIFYIWRVVEVAYFAAPPDYLKVKEAPVMLLLPTVALTVLCIAFGVATKFTVGVANFAASSLGVLP
ncbi:MAG: cation:proton antiporter [Rhodospirillaceae bacterium]|nr:cation:proton antiporter [Rhodospirillaceae bacterium]